MGGNLLSQALIVIAAMAFAVGWFFDWQALRRKRALVRWTMQNRSDSWESLSLVERNMLSVALGRLRERGLAEDPEFEERFQEYRHYATRMWQAVSTGVAILALAWAAGQL